MQSSVLRSGAMMWLCAVAFYLYQYILRVSPGVMANDIMGAFSLDAKSFGTLAAIATYCYAILQVPAGVMSDLYGSRRMVLISILLCVSGITLFAWSEHLFSAYVGRILIGSGSACAFICVSKVSSDWFPREKKILLFALTIVAGTFGALLGGAPLASMTQSVGWRDSLFILVAIGIVIFLVNFFLLRNRHTKQIEEVNRHETWEMILSVFKSRLCWMYSLVAIGIYLSISVFADLWGVSFFMQKFGVSKEEAAGSVSMIYMGTCIGCIVVAMLSQKIKNPRIMIGSVAFLITALLSILLFAPNLSFKAATILLFIIGLCTGGEILCFTSACNAMSISVAGTVTGFLNFVVTLGGALVQQQVGFLLNYFWDGVSVDLNNVPIYSTQDFQVALSTVIIFTLASFILSFFLAKPVYEVAQEG
jgi:sugar phosphate permease